jgi:hypothetical protein
MAKLTDRQKNNILAKWNTGEYTKTELAKAYKVSDVMIGKIVGKEEPTNSHLVEAGVLFEKAKKLEKSSAEISAIDQAIKHRLEKEYNDYNNRLKVYDITGDILDGVKNLIKGGKAQKPTTATVGDGIVESNIVEYDLQAEHYEKAMNTVDKASIVLKVSDRHAPKVEVNNANNQQTNIEAPQFNLHVVPPK